MDLLNPHMFTREQLLHIFNQRNFFVPNETNISREDLLVIYYNYALPLPQRTGSKNILSPGKSESIGSSNHHQFEGGDELKDNTRTRAKFARIAAPCDSNGSINKRVKLNISTHESSRMDLGVETAKKSNGIMFKSLKRNNQELSTGIEQPDHTASKHKKITWP